MCDLPLLVFEGNVANDHRLYSNSFEKAISALTGILNWIVLLQSSVQYSQRFVLLSMLQCTMKTRATKRTSAREMWRRQTSASFIKHLRETRWTVSQSLPLGHKGLLDSNWVHAGIAINTLVRVWKLKLSGPNCSICSNKLMYFYNEQNACKTACWLYSFLNKFFRLNF